MEKLLATRRDQGLPRFVEDERAIRDLSSLLSHARRPGAYLSRRNQLLEVWSDTMSPTRDESHMG